MSLSQHDSSQNMNSNAITCSNCNFEMKTITHKQNPNAMKRWVLKACNNIKQAKTTSRISCKYYINHNTNNKNHQDRTPQFISAKLEIHKSTKCYKCT